MQTTDNRKRAVPRYDKGTVVAILDCPCCGKPQPAYLDKKGKVYHGCHLPKGCGFRSHWGRNFSDNLIDEWEAQPSNDNTRMPANDNKTTAQQVKRGNEK